MYSVSRSLLNRKFAQTCQRSASCLVVAEHNGTAVNQATLSCITAATKIGGDISVLLTGHNLGDLAKTTSQIAGVHKVLVVDNSAFANPMAEDMTQLLTSVSKNYSHIVTASSNKGKNFMPRLAAALNVSPVSDVMAVVNETTFKRPMYAGNAVATVENSDAIKLVLVRPTSFEQAATSGGSATIAALEGANTSAVGLTKFISSAVKKSDRPDLQTSRVVVSGGRAMKSEENFGMLFQLADKLGGAVGASRAAVDAGFASHEMQVGQTGKVVAPQLYIAVGISGAIQHLSGMKDSKVIVAINKDKEAPIFQVADYGLVDDLFKAIPEMNSKV